MLNKNTYTKQEVERIIEFTEMKCNQRYKYHIAGIIIRYLKANPNMVDCYNNQRAYEKALEFQALAIGQLNPESELKNRLEFLELTAEFDAKNKNEYTPTAVIQKLIDYFLQGIV